MRHPILIPLCLAGMAMLAACGNNDAKLKEAVKSVNVIDESNLNEVMLTVGDPDEGQVGALTGPGQPSGDLEAERGHVGGEDLERRAEPGRLPIVGLGEPRPVQRVHALLREGVHSGAEQVLHLLGGHLVAGVQTVDAGHPRPQPHAGALAALGVVGRQTEVALLGGVLHRDLPGQVVIPRSGGDLVQAHHTNQK